MSKEEIIEALENLLYFEDTDEGVWVKIQIDAERAIAELKKLKL